MTESTLFGKFVKPTAPLHIYFKIDANEARAFMENILCGVETVKRLVNFHLYCNISKLKTISKTSTLPPLDKFLRKPMLI